MKKIFGIIATIFFICLAKNSFTQCNPFASTGTTYFSPLPDSMGCIERGKPYSGVIYFEISGPVFPGFPQDSITIDTITGLPAGLSYIFNPGVSTIAQPCCIEIFGTTYDSTGVDSLYIQAAVWVHGTKYQGELGRLLRRSNIPFSTYYLNVIDSGSVCSNFGGLFTNMVTGSVFYDADTNGVLDSVDGMMSNMKVKINSGQAYTFTQQTGNYYFFTDSGNYTVSMEPPQYYAFTGLSTYNIRAPNSGQTFAGNDFGLTPIILINDLQVSLTASRAAPGSLILYWIQYQNSGTTVLNGTMTLTYDSILTSESTSVGPLSQSGNTLTWEFKNLMPGQQHSILATFRIPANINLIGDTLFSSVFAPIPNDIDSRNNIEETIQIINGSMDPNDKTIIPNNANEGVLPEETFTYTIRFQNTGTDTAFRIDIRDTLDDYLEVSSFKPIATSHPAIIQLKDKYLSWTFDNILLPDSAVNETESHGFVKFSVKPENNVADQTIILNRASIYFDFNPPVITNSVEAKIDFGTGIEGNLPVSSFAISPNPLTQTAALEYTLQQEETLTIRLLDLQGKTIRTFLENTRQDAGQHQQAITLPESLPSGSYLIVIESAKGKMGVKVIK